MRFDDALCAISSAYNGVIIGSGLSLYKISEELDDDAYFNVYKTALKTPLKQILLNAGVGDNILKNIIDSNYTMLYNASTFEYENIETTMVLDSLDVVVNSLINATSIAGMLLTTNSLIINENNNKIEEDL